MVRVAVSRPGGSRPAARARTLLALLLVATVGGCASYAPPQPWEKGYLARPDMQFDADRLDARYTQHIYFSKEGAAGGYGIGGGGCGCN